MTWTLVASGRAKDAVTLNTTGANVLIATVTGGSFGSASGWDNKGNTWTLLTESLVGTHRSRIVYCLSPSSVGDSHTITDPNAGIQDAEIHFYAFTAPGTPAYHSENASNDATFGGASTKSASYAGSLSVTPPSNDALILAVVHNEIGSGSTSNYSVNSGFTVGLSLPATTGPTVTGGASVYLNQAVAANVDPTISWTGSCRWSAAIAVFTTSGGGGTTIYPSSDITDTGWTNSSGTDSFALIDEPTTPNDSDYITSPSIGTGDGITMGLSQSISAGAYEITLRAKYTGTSGKIKATLLNDSNVSQGDTGWITLSATETTYLPIVQVAGTATRIKLEVQA